ncbi:TPA: hypothetical protein I8Z15_001938 [Legionella pneumophila]|nr:hypothetical protein [Legionella pneumophila]
MRDYWELAERVTKYLRKVSVVGFLDEGLLAIMFKLHEKGLRVSVVGFLDEGLLGALGADYEDIITFQWLDF